MLPTEEREPDVVPTSVGIACVASYTHRADPTDNQDSASKAIGDNFHAVVVADGLGSFPGAADAALVAAELAHRSLQSQVGGYDPEQLFRTVSRGVRLGFQAWHRRLSSVEQADIPCDKAFGTTLIVGAETANALSVAYVGNGCAFHIRGDFAWFPEHVALPWSFTNVLNPHTTDENGREALYRYLSPTSTPAMTEPSVVTIRKDRYCGDLLLIATDGLYSSDQVRQGRDPEGEVWISTERTLLILSAALRQVFLAPGELDVMRVQEAMADCLFDMRRACLLDDDTSIGLLITPQALAFRRLRLADEEG